MPQPELAEDATSRRMDAAAPGWHAGKMLNYKVWDEMNSGEEYAQDIEALDAGDAAELFASEDVDGNTDGIYEDGGHVIAVRSPVDGQVHRFKVCVEYEPTYSACLVETS